MKKSFIIAAVVLVVIIGTMLAIPVFFKKNLLEVTKNTLNRKFDAEIEFADMKLSLFQNFPRATVGFSDVMIKGKGEFENDTLLHISHVATQMDLSSLFRKSDMSIEEIILDRPDVKLVVGESGSANWDIAPAAKNKPSGDARPVQTDGNDNTFQLQLEKIAIKNASLVYDDRRGKMGVALKGIDFDISGKMYGTTTELEASGRVDKLDMSYNRVNYISNTSIDLSTLLMADLEAMRFDLSENELMVNRLPLELDGSFSVPGDTTYLDLQVKTKESDFGNFLALIPPSYESYLSDVQTDGLATISGSVTGFYAGDNYPALSLKMQVADGNFRYADLPEEIKNIKADVRISKPQGDMDLAEIKVAEAHAEIRENPVDLTMLITNPVSDPQFDGAFIGKINLDHLKDALPLDSVNISGEIDANFFVEGNYSDVEAEAYEKIKSDGVVLLDNFVYDSPKLTQRVRVPKGRLDFSPKSINLQEMMVRVGQSDFRLSGSVSDYLNYLLKDGTLRGNLQLTSKQVNLNEMLRLQAAPQQVMAANGPSQRTANGAPESGDTEEEVLAFDVPENIDIVFRSDIDYAVIDRLPITNIRGQIHVADRKLMLNDLSMDMLDGRVKMNGSYRNTGSDQPFVDFGFDIDGFDIPLMYRSLTGIRRMLPVAGKSRGKFSSAMQMKGRLSPQMKLIGATANGTGSFGTSNLQVIDSRTFDQLKGILREDKLKNVTIDDFNAVFTVENGNLHLPPFKTKVSGQETTVSGSLNTESLIDMRLDFNVQRDAFGPDIQNILAVIPGNKNIKTVPAGVLIRGPVAEPKVSMDLSETRKTITNATKNDLQKSLDKLGKGLKKLFEK